MARHVEHPSITPGSTVFTIQLPKQKLAGMVAAGKKAKDAELKAMGMLTWPNGLSGVIDKMFSAAREAAASGARGEEPFHVVVTGTIIDPGVTPTISMSVSGTNPADLPPQGDWGE